MVYELYTVPRCEGCEDVKNFLNGKGISYSVWNLKDRAGSKYFGKVFLQIDGKLKRNISDNKSLLPILIEVNESRSVIRLGQQLNEIKAMFE